MKTIMWRMGEECGVLYTEDRQVLRRLFEMEKFPAKREADAAVYRNPRGKVFAWQVTFAPGLWNRVLRTIGGKEAVTIWREPVERTPAPPAPQATQSSSRRRRETVTSPASADTGRQIAANGKGAAGSGDPSPAGPRAAARQKERVPAKRTPEKKAAAEKRGARSRRSG